MGKIKVMHCSDFHFDTPFSGLDKDKAEQRREELRENFSSIIRVAKENNVQVMLMAGDLFDGNAVSYETISLIQNRLRDIPEIKVFISPGNHDPFVERSYYNAVQWPSNVYIFRNYWGKVDVDELNLTVYGRGFGTSYEKESFLKGFTVEDSSRINIMVIHGEVVTAGGASVYNPVNEKEIEKSGLDYLALGHVHTCSGIRRAGNSCWSYSGCPEGRGFDEQGPKGVLLGEVGKNLVKLDFIETCRRRYMVHEVDITGCQNYEDILLKLGEPLGIKDLESGFSPRDIYKLILKGEISKEFTINTSVICEKLKYYFYMVKAVDDTRKTIDYQALSQEYTLKGIFVNKMLNKLKAAVDETERNRLEKALKLGLNALELREGKLE
ncbi:MAG: DNA repair exonuclease [Bacillota bacterium]|nr:DNA repair exonuclease [Bacillota bacterium]